MKRVVCFSHSDGSVAPTCTSHRDPFAVFCEPGFRFDGVSGHPFQRITGAPFISKPVAQIMEAALLMMVLLVAFVARRKWTS